MKEKKPIDYAYLVTLAQCGDQDAATQLFNATKDTMLSVAMALVRNEEVAKDIVQDAYVSGFMHLDRLQDPSQYRAWMKKIVTNTAKNYLKRKKPILFAEMANEDGEVEFREERIDHLPELDMDRKETARIVDSILDTLPEDQRLVLVMHFINDMPIREIAQQLGIPENTVKSRMLYGKKKVETRVRDLEKNGVKLYSLAPLPFLLALMSTDASADAISTAGVLENILAKSFGSAAAGASAAAAGIKTASAANYASAGVKTGAKAAGKTAAKAAAKSGAKALGTKIAAGALAVTMVGGGAAYAMNKLAAPKDPYAAFEGYYVAEDGCYAVIERTTSWYSIGERWSPEKPAEGASLLVRHECGREYENPDGKLYTGFYSTNDELEVDGNTLIIHWPDEEFQIVREEEGISFHGEQSSGDGIFYTPDSYREKFGEEQWQMTTRGGRGALARDAYQAVITEYTEVLCADSADILANPDAYNKEYLLSHYPDVRSYHRNHNMEFYYAYYDIDHDGTEELLFGASTEGGPIEVVKVFGFDGYRPWFLSDINPVVTDASVTIYQDGRIRLRSPGEDGTKMYEGWQLLQGYHSVMTEPSTAPEVTDFFWQKMDLSVPYVLEPTQPEEPEQAITPQLPVLPEVTGPKEHVVYQQVLEDYLITLFAEDSAYYADLDSFVFGNRASVSNYHSSRGTEYAYEFYYAYYDIDHDGTDELLIGISGGEYAPELVDIHDYDGRILVDVMGDPTLGSGRTSLKLYQDSTICFSYSTGASGWAEEWYRIEGHSKTPCAPSSAQEVTDIVWQNLTGTGPIPGANPGGQTTAAGTFDTIRSRIREACLVTDYDSDPSYYDIAYADLGPGIMWMLCNRDDGVHTLNVFAVEFDIDGDGEDELCIARGVTTQHNVNVFAVYDRTADGIVPIYGDAVFTYLEPFPDGQLPVDWMEWEYLTM